MRYIKTFESFSPINESFLGIDFSKVKEAIQAVKSEFENNILPNLGEEEKAELEAKAQQFFQKQGIKSSDDLINKVSTESEEHKDQLEEVADEVGVNESFMMINEEMGERMARFFKRLGTYTGIGSLLFGFSSFASHLMGYIDFGSFMVRVHEITGAILGIHAGPIGFLIMVAGALLALGSQIWGYNRGV